MSHSSFRDLKYWHAIFNISTSYATCYDKIALSFIFHSRDSDSISVCPRLQGRGNFVGCIRRCDLSGPSQLPHGGLASIPASIVTNYVISSPLLCGEKGHRKQSEVRGPGHRKFPITVDSQGRCSVDGPPTLLESSIGWHTLHLCQYLVLGERRPAMSSASSTGAREASNARESLEPPPTTAQTRPQACERCWKRKQKVYGPRVGT